VVEKKFSTEEYALFFGDVETILQEILPPGLRQLHTSEKDRNFIKITFPSLSNISFEIQINIKSIPHKNFYGKDCSEVFAFYDKSPFRTNWIREVSLFKGVISSQLDRELKAGIWNEKWTTLGFCLDINELGKNPEQYARLAGYFIQAAYVPISIAYQKSRY